MTTLSLRGYARRRGCTLRAVQKAIIAGRLASAVTRDEKGRPRIVDAALADQEWERSTKSEHIPHSVQAAKVPPATMQPPAVADAAPTLAASRARLERARAEKAEIELASMRGEVMPTAQIEAQWIELITRTQTKLLGIPSKMKSTLPHLTRADVATIDKLIREALEDLAAGAE
jgi:hypothetical protein